MEEDEENKGHLVLRRSSSILKLPLSGIDPNKQIKQTKKEKRRSSKRVSFAKTLDVWEFNKESQSENSDKNAFRNNKDDGDENTEMSGINSLLTGEIKNPAPNIENISDAEDSCDEGEPSAILNYSIIQSPEKAYILQDGTENKENINIISSPNNRAIDDDDVLLKQSIYCQADQDNISQQQKLNNKLFSQQSIQRIRTTSSSSSENSPILKAASQPSITTKMFLDNLMLNQNDSSSSCDIGSERKALPDCSMERSNNDSASDDAALNKSLYYVDPSEPANTTVYFNDQNHDQMDFTICNNKVFSDFFKMGNPTKENENPANVTTFGNLDDTNVNMDLTRHGDGDVSSNLNALVGFGMPKCPSDLKDNSPKTGDVTVYFSSNLMHTDNMDLTTCHGNAISDHPSMDSQNKNIHQAMTLINGAPIAHNSISNISSTRNLMESVEVDMEFSSTGAAPLCPVSTEKMLVNESMKENIVPSFLPSTVMESSSKSADKFGLVGESCKTGLHPPHSAQNLEIENDGLHQNFPKKTQKIIGLNSDENKENLIDAAILDDDRVKQSSDCANLMELSCKKAILITGAEPTNPNTVSKKPKKRVSFSCPPAIEPSSESLILDDDEPPLKKLSCSNQDEPHLQNLSSISGQHQISLKDQQRKSVNFEDLVVNKDLSKSKPKNVSFCEPSDLLNNSNSDYRPEVNLAKIATEKVGSVDHLSKNSRQLAKEDLLDKIEVDTVSNKETQPDPDKIDLETNEFETGKQSILRGSFSESTSKEGGSNVEINTKNRMLGSVKSFHEDLNNELSMRDDLLTSEMRQVGLYNDCSKKRKMFEETKNGLIVSQGSSEGAKHTVPKLEGSLNQSGVLKNLIDKSLAERDAVDCKGSTETREKTVSFYLGDDEPSAEVSLPPRKSENDSEEVNQYLYISSDTSGVFIDQLDNAEDKRRDENERVKSFSDDRRFPEGNNDEDAIKPINSIDGNECVTNKCPSVDSNSNSGIVKCFSRDEKSPEHEHSDKATSDVIQKESLHSKQSSLKLNDVDQDCLSNGVVLSESTQSKRSCEINDKAVVSVSSPPKDKVMPMESPTEEDLSEKSKDPAQSSPVKLAIVNDPTNQGEPNELPRLGKLQSTKSPFAKIPNFKSSWQGMFSIHNVIKNIKQSRSGMNPIMPGDPAKTDAVSALSIMQHKVPVCSNNLQVDSIDSTQDKRSDGSEVKERMATNTYVNDVSDNQPIKESQNPNVIVKPSTDPVCLPSRAKNDSAEISASQTLNPDPNEPNPKLFSKKAPETICIDSSEKNLSAIDNFNLDDLSCIMNERSDILVNVSYCEATEPVSQNNPNPSLIASNKLSFSNKSIDNMKNSLLSLASFNSSLCSRMLSNVHLLPSETKISAIEVDSIEELLLLIGIDKLENIIIDYRYSNADQVPIDPENLSLGEKFHKLCLERPKYENLLQAYESLKTEEQILKEDFHQPKLVEDFQCALQKKSDKLDEDFKKKLFEDFQKCFQLSQQKSKQRKTDFYENLCSDLKDKLVVVKNARSQLNDISQKIDEKLESLDQVLNSLDKELNNLDALPQLTDEDFSQCYQVRKFLDDVNEIQKNEQKLSNQCSQLSEQEKSLKEEYSKLETRHANLLKNPTVDTSELLSNCKKLKIYSVLFPWRIWQLQNDRQKYNFWNDTLQLCIHTENEKIIKAHFDFDENWKSVAKDHTWLEVAHEIRLDVFKEEDFLASLQDISQLPQLLSKIGKILNNIQDLSKEVISISLRKVITRQTKSLMVTYCCSSQLSKIQVCFQFDPCKYPTSPINHHINLHYGNVRCQDISRKLKKVMPGLQYLTRLVKAVHLESFSSR